MSRWTFYYSCVLLLIVAVVSVGANAPPGDVPASVSNSPDVLEAPKKEITSTELARAMPSVYTVKAREWGCCRQCLPNDPFYKKVKVVQVPIQLKDPSRFVNCCPFCPATVRKAREGLGPYEWYYKHHIETQMDRYENLLKTHGTHMDQPTHKPLYGDSDYTYPYDREREEELTQEKELRDAAMAAAASKGGKGKGKGNSLIEMWNMLTGRATPPAKQATRAQGNEGFDLEDPYAYVRGNDMEKGENYVYGFPGNGELQKDPPQPGLPPCCTICTRTHDSLDIGDETGCCVHCASTILGNAPWRNRRQRAYRQNVMDTKRQQRKDELTQHRQAQEQTRKKKGTGKPKRATKPAGL